MTIEPLFHYDNYWSFFYFGMVFEGHIIRVVRSPMLTIRHLRL